MDKLTGLVEKNLPTDDGHGQAKIRQQDLEKVSQQFEAIFMRSMMKEMRKVNEVFDSKDNPFNSDSVRMLQGLYDDTLCNQLSQHHGIGIAEMVVKQLSAHKTAPS